MSTRYCFANVDLSIPHGWVDYSDNLPDGSPPTLSRGVQALGALQFTTGRYVSGAKPRFDRLVLQLLLRDFEQSHKFPMAQSLDEFVNPNSSTFGVFADYQLPEQFTRVWYVSDGDDIVLATYVTLQEGSIQLEQELSEAHAIVQSIVF